ncbi:MAG TPA: hypothetical protein VK066_25305 [Chloroflexota bacterium]|nr:hypothetical protein [Chloroflexota bacterium]
MVAMTNASGKRVRLALGAPDGARGGPRPAGGWPVLDGRVEGTVPGPFLGLEGPGFEKTWYVVALDAPLPAGFDPFHTLDAHPLTAPVGRVLLRPDLVEPPPPDEIRALPADVIGAALAAAGRARVSVYVGLDAGAVPARLSLGALKDGPIRWLCAAWAEFLPNCS